MLKLGDIVQAIRPPLTFPHHSAAGLYGYISLVGPEGDSHVILYPTHGKEDTRYECFAADALKPITKGKWHKFLTPLAKAAMEEAAKPEDPNDPINKLTAKMTDPAYLAREKRKAKRRDRLAATIPNPFLSEIGIGRLSKHKYRCLSSPEGREIMHVPMRYCQLPRNKVSMEQQIHWARANSMIDHFSYWPDQEIVRNLVGELDLDPYVQVYNTALYQPTQQICAPRPKLRKSIIRLLNQGWIILGITPVTSDMRCRDDGDHYIVYHAKRKRLPVA